MDHHDCALSSTPPKDFPVRPSEQSQQQHPQPQHPNGSGGSAPSIVAHTDEPATRIKPQRVRRCYNCWTTTTSAWRRSTKTPGKVVCNRCGLIERTKAFPHPVRGLPLHQTALPTTPALSNHAQHTITSHVYSMRRHTNTGAQLTSNTVRNTSVTHPSRDNIEAQIPLQLIGDYDNRHLQPGSLQGYLTLQNLGSTSSESSSRNAVDDASNRVLGQGMHSNVDG